MKIRAEHNAVGPLSVGDLLEQLIKVPADAVVTWISANGDDDQSGWGFIAEWSPNPEPTPADATTWLLPRPGQVFEIPRDKFVHPSVKDAEESAGLRDRIQRAQSLLR